MEQFPQHRMLEVKNSQHGLRVKGVWLHDGQVGSWALETCGEHLIWLILVFPQLDAIMQSYCPDSYHSLLFWISKWNKCSREIPVRIIGKKEMLMESLYFHWPQATHSYPHAPNFLHRARDGGSKTELGKNSPTLLGTWDPGRVASRK